MYGSHYQYDMWFQYCVICWDFILHCCSFFSVTIKWRRKFFVIFGIHVLDLKFVGSSGIHVLDLKFVGSSGGRKSLAGQTSVRLNVETWLCHRPELSSVVEAFMLQHQSSQMPFLSTSAQHPSGGQINQAYVILWEHVVFKSVLVTYLLPFLCKK